MRELTSTRRPAASGTGKSMVILLHGYGADAADLIGLADPLSPHMPDTVFVAPNAPEKNAMNPMGYQWFPIPWIDGATEEQATEGMMRAADDLNGFLDATYEAEGIGPENTIIFGFSQGTMMALHVVPRRADEVAGIVGFSGRLLAPETLAAEAVTKPPVLLVHGDMDDMVPPQSLNEAGQALNQAGFTVYAHVMKGTGHGISPDGLGVALQFMKEQLGT